ncbi:unnamed protein product, partial [Sphacelaria rigidula]
AGAEAAAAAAALPRMKGGPRFDLVTMPIHLARDTTLLGIPGPYYPLMGPCLLTRRSAGRFSCACLSLGPVHVGCVSFAWLLLYNTKASCAPHEEPNSPLGAAIVRHFRILI